jgi:hypothetical protein
VLVTPSEYAKPDGRHSIVDDAKGNSAAGDISDVRPSNLTVVNFGADRNHSDGIECEEAIGFQKNAIYLKAVRAASRRSTHL